MTQIREAKERDSVGINEISQYLGYKIKSQEIAKERLITILTSIIDKLWVYEDDQQIKGWVHLFISHRVASASFAEIGGLVVAPNYRRAGIGRHL